MVVQIETEARPHETDEIQFGADGEVYEFVTPKAGILLSGLLREQKGETNAFTAAKLDWLEQGMYEEDWLAVQGRLSDPDDALDMHHLTNMVDALLAGGAMRPPSSSGDSSKPPRKKTGGAKPKAKAATAGTSRRAGSAT